MTVKEAVKKIYTEQKEVFFMIDLIEEVRCLLERPFLFDSTISRKLRELRSESIDYNYKVVNRKKSIYFKEKNNDKLLQRSEFLCSN